MKYSASEKVLNEVKEVHSFMLERVEHCRKIKRQSILLMFAYFWNPRKFKRVKAIYKDAKEAEGIYRCGIDVLSQNKKAFRL